MVILTAVIDLFKKNNTDKRLFSDVAAGKKKGVKMCKKAVTQQLKLQIK